VRAHFAAGVVIQIAGIYSGNLLSKRLYRHNGVVILQPNSTYSARCVLEDGDLGIWRVVRYSVRNHAHWSVLH